MSNMSYTPEKIIFIKLHKTHIPYYAGMLVRGPHDKYYYLDEFCTEMAIKSSLRMPYLPNPTARMMGSAGRRMGNLVFVSGDAELDSLLGKYRPEKLLREAGKLKATIVGGNLAYSLLDE